MEEVTMARATVSIAIPEELAEQLPSDPGDQQRVVALGIREWRIRKALAAYQQGEGSLAFAARQAGVSLREIIPLAYAYGLVPKVEPADLETLDLQLSTL
jgi:hypothetical protein